jgi:TRAP-type C4-dicarboxylate transport system permease small subunit
MLNLLQRAEQVFSLLGRWVMIVSLAVCLVFTVGQAVDRYGPHSSFNSYDQIAQLATVWLTFIGNMLALRDNTNIRVDLIDGMLSAAWLRIRNIVSDIAILALMVVIQAKIWRLVELGAGQMIIGTPFTSAHAYLALAFGSALCILIIAVRLILDIGGRRAV